MEEQQNEKTKRNKLFIFGAIALVVLLFVLAVAEIISINSMNSKIKQQEQTIEQLNNQLNYYKDHANQSDDVYEGVVEWL